ncbi:unnamed protein product [Arabidopsis lyrata]|nr:unnamed protein product [Arabidopsis lyrata]
MNPTASQNSSSSTPSSELDSLLLSSLFQIKSPRIGLHVHRRTPTEFLCPITGFLMSDPVVVASGQTFERISVQVCRNLGFAPKLHDGPQPDLSTVIPNLAMKSTILSWCDRNKMEHPRPPDYAYVEGGVVRTRMNSIPPGTGHRIAKSEILPPVAENSNSNSDSDYESVMGAIRSRSRTSISSTTSLPLYQTRPVNHSTRIQDSFSTSDYSSFPPMSPEEEEIYNKLSSVDTIDHEQGLIQLRKTTRSNEGTRISLCTDRILSLLRSLIVSRIRSFIDRCFEIEINGGARTCNRSFV